jgi:ribosomal 50S subunit-recycling heat shock protein
VGEILASAGNEVTAKIHNMVRVGDTLEIVTKEKNVAVKIKKILDKDREEVASAHGGHGNLYYIVVNKKDIESYSLLRKVLQ